MYVYYACKYYICVDCTSICNLYVDVYIISAVLSKRALTIQVKGIPAEEHRQSTKEAILRCDKYIKMFKLLLRKEMEKKLLEITEIFHARFLNV